jgi:hypothetical protein
MLTDEDKLLGITEKSPKKMLEKTIFTNACRYEVHTEGRDNISIESGHLIDSLLPLNEKQRLLNGENEITYNGLVIKKLTDLEPKKAEKKEVPTEEKQKAKKVTTRKKAK